MHGSGFILQVRRRAYLLASVLLVVGLSFVGFSVPAKAAVNDGSSFILGAWQLDSDLGGLTLAQYEDSLNIHFNYHKRYIDWDTAFDSSSATQWYSEGRTIDVDWQPDINGTGLRFGDIAAGMYDSYIRTFAQAVKSFNHPVQISIAPEMNGWWSLWAINGQPGRTNTDYINGYHHIVDIFRLLGANNVQWTWSPSIEDAFIPVTYHFADLYPGDNYITYMGLDGYNWGTQDGGTWQSFTDVFDFSLKALAQISHKPILLMEVGSAEQGGNKGDWIRDMFAKIPNYPQLVGFTWFNRLRERDWRIHSTPASKQGFIDGAASFFAKSSPTPTPTPTPTPSGSPSPTPSGGGSGSSGGSSGGGSSGGTIKTTPKPGQSPSTTASPNGSGAQDPVLTQDDDKTVTFSGPYTKENPFSITSRADHPDEPLFSAYFADLPYIQKLFPYEAALASLLLFCITLLSLLFRHDRMAAAYTLSSSPRD